MTLFACAAFALPSSEGSATLYGLNIFAEGVAPEFPWLNDLNQQQREAVKAGNGPVLVLAGADPGKTKTLSYRVARLVCSGVDPSRIMLVTFTSRAAEEMIRLANVIAWTAQPETSAQASACNLRGQFS